MSRTLTAVPTALMLLLLAACGGGEDDDPEGQGGGQSTAADSPGADAGADSEPADPGSSEAAPAPAGDVPEVELLDEGAEPRVPFAIDVEVGETETSVLTVDQEIDAGQVIDVPAIEITLTNEVVAVGETIELRTTYDDVSVVDPGAEGAAEIEAAISSIEGVSGTTVLSPQGATLSVELDIPDDVDPTVRQTLDQFQDQASSLSVPFPEEDLGVGASWRITNEPTISDVTVRQTTTYEVTSLDGDQYELAVTVDQETLPGTSQGAQIIGGSGTTEGTTSGTAGALAPDRADSSGTNSVTVESGGQQQEVRTTTTTTIETTDG